MYNGPVGRSGKDQHEIPNINVSYSPARYLIPNQIGRVHLIVQRWGLTSNEEHTVVYPYGGCDPNGDNISFPNGDAGGIHKRLLSGDDRISEGQKTYMRSTSKNEAAARARYPKT